MGEGGSEKLYSLLLINSYDILFSHGTRNRIICSKDCLWWYYSSSKDWTILLNLFKSSKDRTLVIKL